MPALARARAAIIRGINFLLATAKAGAKNDPGSRYWHASWQVVGNGLARDNPCRDHLIQIAFRCKKPIATMINHLLHLKWLLATAGLLAAHHLQPDP